jgi:hypothetical protein
MLRDKPAGHGLWRQFFRRRMALPDPGANLKSGVNSDALLGDLDRFDDCHFSSSGEQKVARAWADLLSTAR